MDDLRVERMADALVHAHQFRSASAPAPAGLAGDVALAYAVQDRLVSKWRLAQSDTVFGWKLGMTTDDMKRRTGITEPASGVILARRVRYSGATLSTGDFVHMGLEGEIAVRVGAPFPETESVDAATALSRLDSVAAAFEISDDRHADWSQLDAATLIADNIWNMGVVLGPARLIDEHTVLTGRRGIVTVNGVQRDQGMSEDIGCDPAAIVAWLGAHLARRNQPLRPGQWIMTGSFVPTTFPKPGDRYRFSVEGLEPVEATIA
ncbi:hypothetical protein BH09PSE6_BH09PSE6_03110 [soil metagenome]